LESGLANLQLDIVGFLAILGEDAVKRTSQLASLSRTFLLLRLLPAPHSSLYVQRPECLETVKAIVTRADGSVVQESLPHIAAAMLYVVKPPYNAQAANYAVVIFARLE